MNAMHTDDYFELVRNQQAMTEQEVRTIVDAYASDRTATKRRPYGADWLWGILLLLPFLVWLAATNVVGISNPTAPAEAMQPHKPSTPATLLAPSSVTLSSHSRAIGDSAEKKSVPAPAPIPVSPTTTPSFPDSLTTFVPPLIGVQPHGKTLHYGFPVGKRLVYRRISDGVDHSWGRSDLFTVDAAFEVQGYDPSGNVQLLITTLREQLVERKKPAEISLSMAGRSPVANGAQPAQASTSAASPDTFTVHATLTYGTNIPILQAVFSPQGKYVRGVAVKYSEAYEKSLQPPADPKVIVHRASPESIIRNEAEKWLNELPLFITLTTGTTWVDTVFEQKNMTAKNSQNGETKQKKFRYSTISTYRVMADTLINNTSCAHLFIDANKQEEGSSWQVLSTQHLFFRKTDTVLVRQESEYTIPPSSAQPSAWTKITKELIAEE
ncbi:MAG: hypothetical protein JNJ94_01805 [Chlorobi bacterium]|nr:hypothetical protein [Chlorobiota bacterium]